MAREKYPSDEVERLMLRFPPGLRERIADKAKANGRSMNAEIVQTLEMFYPPAPSAEELAPILESVLRMSDAGKVRSDWANLLNLLREFEARLALDRQPREDPEGAN